MKLNLPVDDVDDKEQESDTSAEKFISPGDEKGGKADRQTKDVAKSEDVAVTEEKQNALKNASAVEEPSFIENPAALKSLNEIRSYVAKEFEDISEIWSESYKSGTEREETGKDENSLLERTTDGRTSFGFNRSELCDLLSSSISELMADAASQRRRSLSKTQVPRYRLSDSLLEDSFSSTPRSPRAPQERFTTKMPTSPRSTALVEKCLDSSLVDMMVKSEIPKVISDDKIREIDEQMASLKLRSPSFEKSEDDRPSEVNTSLNDTYENLLEIERPSSVFDKISSTPPPMNPSLKHGWYIYKHCDFFIEE
ncbi:hypothetical protein COOONC_12407 [Cooperia oncophora]